MAVTFTPSGTASAGGVQQSYALVHAALLEGQLSDIRDNTIGTYINETAVVQPFGDLQVYKSAGTVANSAKTLSASGDTVVGINVLTYVDETALNARSRPGVKSRAGAERGQRRRRGRVCALVRCHPCFHHSARGSQRQLALR
jgi:hypothetical protein